MLEGGLAEITTIEIDENRKIIKAGNTRVFDLVRHGNNLVIEYKGSKRTPICANPQEFLENLSRLLTRHP